MGADRVDYCTDPDPGSGEDGYQPDMVWYSGSGQSADSVVKSACRPFCIFLEGGGTRLGSERYISGYDAVYGVASDWININYNFSEKIGITVGLASSGHSFEETDATSGLARFSIGPTLTTPIGGLSWELKPQFSISSSGIVETSGVEVDIDKASGIIIGNSLLFGSNDGLQFIGNIDFVTGKIKEIEGIEIDEDNGYSFFNLGIGLRYNF